MCVEQNHLFQSARGWDSRSLLHEGGKFKEEKFCKLYIGQIKLTFGYVLYQEWNYISVLWNFMSTLCNIVVVLMSMHGARLGNLRICHQICVQTDFLLLLIFWVIEIFPLGWGEFSHFGVVVKYMSEIIMTHFHTKFQHEIYWHVLTCLLS